MTTRSKTVTVSPPPKTLSRLDMLKLLFGPEALVRLQADNAEGWFRFEAGTYRFPGSPAQTLDNFIIAASNQDVRVSPLAFRSLSSGGPVMPVTHLWCSIPILTLPPSIHQPRPPLDLAERDAVLARVTGFKPGPNIFINAGDSIVAFWKLSQGLSVDDIKLVQARWRLASVLEGDLEVAASDGRTRPTFPVPGTRVTSTLPVVDVIAFPWELDATYRIEQFLELKNYRGGGRR